MKAHAVHIAIALQESNLLLSTDPKCPICKLNNSFWFHFSYVFKKSYPFFFVPPVFRQKNDPRGIQWLNYGRLLVSFARTLRGRNSKDAINYLYFLRSMKDDEGNDLFSVCVSDLILESRDFEFLGHMNPDGCRTPGLLETMGINVMPIVRSFIFTLTVMVNIILQASSSNYNCYFFVQISRCASQSELRGLSEDAIILYDLAGKHEEALRILCRVIAKVNTIKVPRCNLQQENNCLE